HERRLDDARRRHRDATEQRVGISSLHHHECVEEGLAHRARGDLRVARIEGSIVVDARIGFRIAGENRLRNALRAQSARGLDDALVAGFRKHDAPTPLARTLEQALENWIPAVAGMAPVHAAARSPSICLASAGVAGRRSKRPQLSAIFFTSSALLAASRSGAMRRLSSRPVRQCPPVSRHHWFTSHWKRATPAATHVAPGSTSAISLRRKSKMLRRAGIALGMPMTNCTWGGFLRSPFFTRFAAL